MNAIYFCSTSLLNMHSSWFCHTIQKELDRTVVPRVKLNAHRVFCMVVFFSNQQYLYINLDNSARLQEARHFELSGTLMSNYRFWSSNWNTPSRSCSPYAFINLATDRYSDVFGLWFENRVLELCLLWVHRRPGTKFKVRQHAYRFFSLITMRLQNFIIIDFASSK